MVDNTSVSELQPGVSLSRLPGSLHVSFAQPRTVLSSAVLNGGFTKAEHFLNLKVPKESKASLELPEVTLARSARRLGLSGVTVGMMTAASLDSLRIHTRRIEEHWISVLVTTGMENARRAGDPADYPTLTEVPAETGTINLAVVTSAALGTQALVEAVMVAAEAKVAAVQDHGVLSPISGALATGTGTDAIAVFCGDTSSAIRYVGKHTLFGERLGALTIEAVTDSLSFDAVDDT